MKDVRANLPGLASRYFGPVIGLLFDPSPTIEPKQRPKVRLLSIYLLLISINLLAGVLALRGHMDAAVIAMAVAGMLLTIGYVISRTRHYFVALLIGIIAPVLPGLAIVLWGLPVDITIRGLVWLSIPLLLTSILLPLRHNYILAAVYLIFIIALGRIGSIDPTILGNMLAYLVLVFFFVIAIAVIRHQDQIKIETQLNELTRAEKDLQNARRGLETLVEERTAELAKANEQLKTEVNERKRAEEMYRRIMELSPTGIITLNTAGVVTACNEATGRLFDRPVSEITGRHFAKIGILGLKEIPWLMKQFARMIAGKEVESAEIALHWKDGSVHIADAQATLIRFEGEKFILATLRDITERQHMEEELRQAYEVMEIRVKERTEELSQAVKALKGEIRNRRKVEDALRQSEHEKSKLLNEAPAFICNLDLKSRITYVNKKLEEETGYLAEEVIGQNLWDQHWFSEDAMKYAKRRIVARLRGAAPKVWEARFRCKDGHYIWLEIEGKLIKKTGIPVGLQVIATNRTERKEAEAERERLFQRVQEKTK